MRRWFWYNLWQVKMDKTLGYWIEKLLGLIIGLVMIFLFFKYWHHGNFISNSQFLDKLITISTTLFGFLLTVLTLIVQSESEAVKKMKAHGSYTRLINFNKNIVLLSGLVCLLSLFLSFCNELLKCRSELLLKVFSTINLGAFTWVIVDTLIFTLIFYKILLSDKKWISATHT